MSKRKQKKGKQRSWTLEEVGSGCELFYASHKRYPTATEFDEYDFLPSSRTIQRKFGGLVQLRSELKLKGQIDFTKGEYSSKRAHMISKRAHILEKEIYEYLVSIFGRKFVHREYFFMDDKRARTDFFVYFTSGNFAIDIFYPANRHNLIGCLNSKIRTYSSQIMLQYPIIFLQMNNDISDDEVINILKQKKNKLHINQHLMTFNQLKSFCKNKNRLHVNK